MDIHKIIFSFCCAAAGAGIGCYGMSIYYGHELGFCRDNDSLFEAYKLAEDKYIADFDREVAQQGMIGGLIDALDDKYSFYNSDRGEAERMVNDHDSTEQTGFQITRDTDTKCALVTDVAADSQAEKCGLQKGDIITHIGGKSVRDEGYYMIIDQLIGKDGKEIPLTIIRNGEEIEVTLVLVNNGSSVDEMKLLDEDVIYYKIGSFSNGGSVSLFEKQLEEVRKETDTNKLIIDLRENDGGESAAPVWFFDVFDDETNTVRMVYERDGKEEVLSTMNPKKYDFETVVLVSKNTLSAAEILTALFQDTGLGTIVGERTGGKGVFQNVEWLPDKTNIYLVEGYYYVNDMPNYNGVGIKPDVEVKMDNSLIGTDDDIQLQKAIELLS